MTEDDDMDADTDHTQGPRQRHADQDFNEGLVPRRDFLGVVLAENDRPVPLPAATGVGSRA